MIKNAKPPPRNHPHENKPTNTEIIIFFLIVVIWPFEISLASSLSGDFLSSL
jgi:hypothetical protein